MRTNQDRQIQDLEKAINKITKGNTIYVSKWEEKRDLDATNGTLSDLLDVVATLIDELKKRGIL